MSETIPPLDPGIVGPLREVDPAPAAVRARARERLLTAVAGQAGQAGQGGQSGPGGGGLGPQGRSGLLNMSGVVAFLLGGVVGAGLYAAMAPVPEPRVVYVDRAAPPTVPAPIAAVPTVPVTAPTQEARTPAVPPASAAPAARESQLSAERILLDEARAALAQGDPARAVDRLQRHRRTFAAPILGEERDAMWVQALVKEGRYDEARASAAAFRKRSPDSLFSSVVDSAIDSIP